MALVARCRCWDCWIVTAQHWLLWRDRRHGRRQASSTSSLVKRDARARAPRRMARPRRCFRDVAKLAAAAGLAGLLAAGVRLVVAEAGPLAVLAASSAVLGVACTWCRCWRSACRPRASATRSASGRSRCCFAWASIAVRSGCGRGSSHEDRGGRAEPRHRRQPVDPGRRALRRSSAGQLSGRLRPGQPAVPARARLGTGLPYARTALSQALCPSLHRLPSGVVHVFSASYWSVPDRRWRQRSWRRAASASGSCSTTTAARPRTTSSAGAPWSILAGARARRSWCRRSTCARCSRATATRRVPSRTWWTRRGSGTATGCRRAACFLSARNLEPYYRVDVTLEAFAMVRDRFPSATLTIAGDGKRARPARAASRRARRETGFASWDASIRSRCPNTTRPPTSS